MKKWIVCGLLLSQQAFADGDIEIKIDWVANVAKSTVLEVCGKAISKSGAWPLVVSVIHGQSTFSTVTNRAGIFCQLVSRQTFKGEVDVTASSMDGKFFVSQTFNSNQITRE